MSFPTASTGRSGNAYRPREGPRGDGGTATIAEPAPTQGAAAPVPRALLAILWGFGVVLCIGVVLAFWLPPPETTTASVPKQPSAGQSATVIDSIEMTVDSARIALVVSIFAFGCGIWMMFTNGVPRRFAGAVLAVSSLLSGGRLNGTLAKLDSLVKIQRAGVSIDIGENPPDQSNRPTQAAAPVVAANHVGSIGPFPVGHPILKDGQSTDAAFDQLRDDYEKLGERNRTMLLLVIGSADRQSLRRGLLYQFDSNTGLAQARAEWVKEQLIMRFPAVFAKSVFLTLTTGPKKTGSAASPNELEKDRTVELWSITNDINYRH